MSTGRFYLEQGIKLSQQQDWQGAITQYQKGIAIQPNEPLLHCQLAEALLAVQDPMGAIHHLETALKLPANTTTQAYTHWLLGKAYEQSNWSALAFAAYSQALILDPNSFTAEAHIFMGNVYLEKRDYPAARTCYQRALALDPYQQTAHSQILHSYLAESDLASAYHKLQECQNFDPSLIPVADILELAIAYAETNDTDTAEELTHQAIRLDPQFAPAHYHLGNIFYQRQQIREAICAYREATDIDPQFAPAYYNLGVALMELQQRAEAIACFEAVLAIDPTFTPAKSWLDDLKPPTPVTSPDTPPA